MTCLKSSLPVTGPVSKPHVQVSSSLAPPMNWSSLLEGAGSLTRSERGGTAGSTTPVPLAPSSQSSPLASESMRAAGMDPGFDAPSPLFRSPSISKPWTVPALRPDAASAETGAARLTYCNTSEHRKSAVQRNAMFLLVRALVYAHNVPRDRMGSNPPDDHRGLLTRPHLPRAETPVRARSGRIVGALGQPKVLGCSALDLPGPPGTAPCLTVETAGSRCRGATRYQDQWPTPWSG